MEASNMRFRDIEQVIGDPNHSRSMSLGDIRQCINRFIEEDSLDFNPVYQRPIVWSDEQQIDFVEFLLRGGANSTGLNIIRFNCPGWMKTFTGKMSIIDGKQRLSSVLRFIDNEIPAFGYYFKEYEDKPRSDSQLIFMINDLPTLKDEIEWFLQINALGTPQSKSHIEKVKRMLKGE